MGKFKIGDKVYKHDIYSIPDRRMLYDNCNIGEIIGEWQGVPSTLYRVKWIGDFHSRTHESFPNTGTYPEDSLISYTQIHRDNLLDELGI